MQYKIFVCDKHNSSEYNLKADNCDKAVQGILQLLHYSGCHYIEISGSDYYTLLLNGSYMAVLIEDLDTHELRYYKVYTINIKS